MADGASTDPNQQTGLDHDFNQPWMSAGAELTDPNNWDNSFPQVFTNEEVDSIETSQSSAPSSVDFHMTGGELAYAPNTISTVVSQQIEFDGITSPRLPSVYDHVYTPVRSSFRRSDPPGTQYSTDDMFAMPNMHQATPIHLPTTVNPADLTISKDHGTADLPATALGFESGINIVQTLHQPIPTSSAAGTSFTESSNADQSSFNDAANHQSNTATAQAVQTSASSVSSPPKSAFTATATRPEWPDMKREWCLLVPKKEYVQKSKTNEQENGTDWISPITGKPTREVSFLGRNLDYQRIREWPSLLIKIELEDYHIDDVIARLDPNTLPEPSKAVRKDMFEATGLTQDGLREDLKKRLRNDLCNAKGRFRQQNNLGIAQAFRAGKQDKVSATAKKTVKGLNADQYFHNTRLEINHTDKTFEAPVQYHGNGVVTWQDFPLEPARKLNPKIVASLQNMQQPVPSFDLYLLTHPVYRTWSPDKNHPEWKEEYRIMGEPDGLHVNTPTQMPATQAMPARPPLAPESQPAQNQNVVHTDVMNNQPTQSQNVVYPNAVNNQPAQNQNQNQNQHIVYTNTIYNQTTTPQTAPPTTPFLTQAAATNSKKRRREEDGAEVEGSTKARRTSGRISGKRARQQATANNPVVIPSQYSIFRGIQVGQEVRVNDGGAVLVLKAIRRE